MGGVLLLIIIAIVIGILWALPLYFCVNLLLLVFHIPFHFTLLQALAICLCASTIKEVFFDKGE